MATIESIKAKIQGLIEKANIVTSRADTQLTPAVDALIAGYGSGGGGFVDVTELPNISEAEADVVYRLIQRVETETGIYVAVYDGEQTTVMSLADMFAAEGAPINIKVHVVPELPELMEPIDEATLTIPFYILESTGIAYLTLDGTNNEVATAGEMFESPAGNGGWIESTENIPQDKLQLGMNFFCMRGEASTVVKGLYLAVNGEWQFFNEIINVDKLPASNINPNALYRMGKKLDRDLYTTVGGTLKKFLDYLEPFNSTIKRIEFVDALPQQYDDTTIFVLNSTGIMYSFNDGVLTNVNSVPLFVLFFGRSLGWVDADNITENVQGIYTCTGEGLFSNEYHKYTQGTWETFSAKPMFIEYLSGTIKELTAEDLKGVVSIYLGAFSDYQALERVEIPPNVLRLQDRAFANCGNLEEVVFNSPSCTIGQEAFMGCTKLKNINLGDMYEISEIHSRAFKGCTSLTSIDISPSSPYFWNWGDGVFEDCWSLERATLNFQNSDGDINPIGTFRGCTSLKDVVLPADWVYNLPEATFYGCTSLKEIELGGDVGQYALAYSGITDITFRGTKAQWASAPNGAKWDRGTPDYVIHCSDGDILKSDPESGSDDTPDVPESSGMEFNIAYGDTAPEDTTKLWVKTSEPSGVVVSPNAEYAEIEGDAVETLADSLPVVRKDVCFSVVGTKAYFFGGTVDSVFSNEILSFDVDNKKFDTLQTTLDSALKNIACAAVGTKIYLFGGQTGSSFNTSQNIIRCFDTETQTMSTCPSTMPKAIAAAVCYADGDKIYIFGGLYSWTYTNYDVFCYDVATDVISTVATISMGVLPSQQGVCKYGNYFYFAIGQPRKLVRINADSFEEEVLYFQDLPNNNSTELVNHAMANVGKYLYVFKYPLKEIWRLDLSSDGNTFERLDVLYDGSELQGNAVTNGEDIYVLGRNTSKFVRYQTIKKLPMVDENSLFVKVSPNATVFPIINTEAAKIEVGIGGAYKGNANGIGEKVEAAIYKNDTWTNI